MSFTKKKIDISFQLPTGKSFTSTSSNIQKISGLRIHASVVKAGGSGMTTTQLRVFGLSPSLMNQVATYGAPPDLATPTTVQIEAGDDEAGMSIVAIGNIQTAAADYNQAPEVAFNITAFTGLLDAIKPAKPFSGSGGYSCATIMQELAIVSGYTFENNGVSVQLSNPYLCGSARDQMRELAEAGDFNWIIDGGTLAIWPKNGSRAGTPVPISPDNGMVGFPTFINQGVSIRSLFNPAIKYGTQIKVQSCLQPACGIWSVYKLEYELQSETPGGAWFMTMEALSPKYVETVNSGGSAS